MTRNAVLVLTTLGYVACAGETGSLEGRQWIDLTHDFDAATIYWPTESGFELETRFQGYTERGHYYTAKSFAAPEHGGTHIDAPVHFYEDRWTVDQIPVERLIGPGVRVDVREQCAQDRDYLIGVVDFEEWEAAYGRMPRGAIVLLDTGFGAFWPDRARYMGTDERGEAAVPKLHFPGLDPSAVDWLSGRSIRAIGLDTPSIDNGPSKTFDAHVRLFEKNIPALENVANPGRLPARGFTVIALPIKIRGGSGGPTRIVALLD